MSGFAEGVGGHAAGGRPVVRAGMSIWEAEKQERGA